MNSGTKEEAANEKLVEVEAVVAVDVRHGPDGEQRLDRQPRLVEPRARLFQRAHPSSFCAEVVEERRVLLDGRRVERPLGVAKGGRDELRRAHVRNAAAAANARANECRADEELGL